MSARVGATIAAVAQLFTEHWPSSARQWMPQGRPPAAGEVVRNPAYARVLERLVEAGADRPDRASRIDAARCAWREGFVARAAVAFLAVPHRHSSGTDHAGVMTAEDLAAFEAGYEPATTLGFRGCTIAKSGPWGQGPALLQALALLDGFDDERLDPSTASARTPCWRRRSSRSPTARPGTATATCRSTTCSRRSTRRSGGR